MINGKPTNPGCESLIQPQFIPPIHSDKVTEPLVSQLCDALVSYQCFIDVWKPEGGLWGLTVSYNIGDAVLVAIVRLSFVEKNGGSSVCH
jgi:hypothetical protein